MGREGEKEGGGFRGCGGVWCNGLVPLDGPLATRLPEGVRTYLVEQGIKSVLVIPLSSRGQVVGMLSFRFINERGCQEEEELEIARALATQASLAIQLTRLARTARESAVLEERNRLAGEIHDSL